MTSTNRAALLESATGHGLDPVERPVVEQRRFRRFSTTLDVEIYWQDEYGLPCVAPAVVRNVSAGGFVVELGAKPPVGSLLIVRTMKESMQCVVRHAQPHQAAYLVGVELLPTVDGETPSQSLERLAAAMSAARRASARTFDRPRLAKRLSFSV